jgi:hypothetical protein
MSENNTVAVESKPLSGSKQISLAFKNKEKFPKGLDTPAQEIVDHLKASGTEVSVPLVNNVKFRIRKAKEEKKAAKVAGTTPKPRGRRVKQPVPVTAAVVSPVQSEFDQMVAVKKLAVEYGGLDNLSKLIEKLRLLAG